jgi:putative NADPH-quinone reductase
MNTLVIYAHPNSQSFNAAVAQAFAVLPSTNTKISLRLL